MDEDLERTAATPPVAYEPAAEAAPSTRVVPPVASPSGSRFRWAIALGVVALVVVASVFAISLFTGRAANATVLGYVPGDSIMYVEARLDLPGDQRNAVGQFLSRFPGFADQSALETKVDEVLDRLVKGATNGDQGYSSDIKPWFGGELAISVGALPDPAELSSHAPNMDNAHFLMLASIKDEAGATAWFDALLTKSGTTTSTESYGGASLTVFSDGQGAFALINGKVAVFGDLASVKAAIDTKGTSGLAAKAEVQTALDSTSGDHVGFVYLALRPFYEWSLKAGGSNVQGEQALLDLIPDWGAFSLRVEGDALVMDAIARTSAGTQTGDSRTSAVADHIPGNAIALSIANDSGKTLLNALEIYRTQPSMQSTVEAIDKAIGILGGPEGAVGWLGDVGISVNRTDGGLEGGLVILPTDRAAAERLFTSLRTLAPLAGSDVKLTFRDEPYAGTTITIVDLGTVADIAGEAGVSPDMLGSMSPTIPGHIELAYAFTDQVIVLGADPGFVRHVLDTTTATSIAANDRYKALAGRVGPGHGITFIDLSAIRQLVESGMAGASPASQAEYEQNVKPYLVPFDALVASGSTKGDVNRSTVIVTIK